MNRVCKECKRNLASTRRRGESPPVSIQCYRCASLRLHEKCGKIGLDCQFRCLTCVREIEKEKKTAQRREKKVRNIEKRQQEEDDKPCHVCAGKSSISSNLMFICDNCGKGQHEKCIKLVEIPKADDPLDWGCDECFVNCGNCMLQGCTLKKERHLDKLLDCIKCRKSFHFCCVNLVAKQHDYICENCNENPVEERVEDLPAAIESDFEEDEQILNQASVRRRSRPGHRRSPREMALGEVALSKVQHSKLVLKHSYPLKHSSFNSSSAIITWPAAGQTSYESFKAKAQTLGSTQTIPV